MKLHFKFLIVVLSALITLGGLTFAEAQGVTKDIEKPLAQTISDEQEIKIYNELQSGLTQTSNEYARILDLARSGASKSLAEKADNWSNLESAVLKNILFAERYNGFLANMQQKYKCRDCVLETAPDGKTLVIKPGKTAKAEKTVKAEQSN